MTEHAFLQDMRLSYLIKFCKDFGLVMTEWSISGSLIARQRQIWDYKLHIYHNMHCILKQYNVVTGCSKYCMFHHLICKRSKITKAPFKKHRTADYFLSTPTQSEKHSLQSWRKIPIQSNCSFMLKKSKAQQGLEGTVKKEEKKTV